jgi:hydrogenase nickel incorporation protein HypA/HybF
MCLAIPSKIISISNDVATIDVYGARKDVSILLLPDEPKIGDYVLVHAGFAIQNIAAESIASGEVMHESAIALSILDIVADTCREKGCTSVDSITVRIGKASGVMPESLTFAFEALKENTVAARARLDVEVVPLGGTCNDCKKEFNVEDASYVFSCPLCGSSSFVINRGREMEIFDMEIH